MDKPVSSLMTTPVITVSGSDTVEAMIENMRWHGVTFAPVVDTGDAVLGVINAYDMQQYDMQQFQLEQQHIEFPQSLRPLQAQTEA